MRDQEKNNNRTDDLVELKDLIQDAPDSEFTLDEILSEYGCPPRPSASAGPDLPWPQAPRRPHKEGKVLTFPGMAPADPEDEFQAPDSAPEEDPAGGSPASEDHNDSSGEEGSQVIPFPEEESVLSAFIKDLGQKADDYADRMFEEDEKTDPEEIHRLEQLIPGTDQEQLDEPDSPRRWRRPPREDPPPPDTAPKKLAQRYGKRLTGLWVRGWFVLLLAVLSLLQALIPVLGLTWLPPLDQASNQGWVSVALLGFGILLSADQILIGLIRLFQGKAGMDTLSALACIFTLLDGVMLSLSPAPEPRLPYSLVCLTGLYFLLHGTYHKRLAVRVSCRTAAAASQPYRVTLDEGKWSGRNTYAKWQGTDEGFGSQIQADDGAQRMFRRVCPLLLLADFLFALLATLGTGHPERLLWALSALFSVSASFGGAIVYGRSFHKIARRLAQSGAALAGWPGIAKSGKGDRVLITDTDLFPPGHVELNGYKVLRDFPAERVVAYTTALILESGSGLGRVFHDQLRSMGGLPRKAEQLSSHEGGGLSANIRGDWVLVGSASFMNLMEIELPQGLNVKNAVFCAINSQLAGIFALNYTLHDTVFPSVEALLAEKVGPVLATRDFNLIPAMLQQRFKLATDKMDFPPVERRWELSDPNQEHNSVLTALLCREGLLPFAEAIAAAKRLYRATRLGSVICCLSSVLGILLAAYLTSIGAYTSLSTLNLLLYLLIWLLPVWLLSSWAHRF